MGISFLSRKVVHVFLVDVNVFVLFHISFNSDHGGE